MGILGHGVDIVSIARFQQIIERQGNSFLERVFSRGEREYCGAHANSAQHFAVRFAAKEAFGKAMGIGIMGAGSKLREVEVFRESEGAPQLLLVGDAKEGFEKTGGKAIFLSLSHDRDFAIASVILTN